MFAEISEGTWTTLIVNLFAFLGLWLKLRYDQKKQFTEQTAKVADKVDTAKDELKKMQAELAVVLGAQNLAGFKGEQKKAEKLQDSLEKVSEATTTGKPPSAVLTPKGP